MSKKTRPNLEEILRLRAAGQIDVDHFERWQQFKEQWSVEDRTRWQTFLGRMHKKLDGTFELRPPLSQLEKQWARDLIHRAEELNLC